MKIQPGGVSVTITIPIIITVSVGEPQGPYLSHNNDPAKQYQLIEGPVPVAQPVRHDCPDCNGRGYRN